MRKSKIALVVGVSGQDGAYLSKFLIQKNYKVHGTSRNIENNNFIKLKSLGIEKKIQLHSMCVTDFESVFYVIKKVKPDEIYNLSGVSSVSLSLQQINETFESIVFGAINILEVIKTLKYKIKYFNADSSEIFGNTTFKNDEDSPMKPASPYAIAKSCSHNIVIYYRKAFKIFASNGILSNHESLLRPDNFVIKKIINHIKTESSHQKALFLGNINIIRDWGYAPEFCEGMWRILQHKKPDDFIIATGKSLSLKNLIKSIKFFSKQRIKIKITKNLFRPLEVKKVVLSTRKIKKQLGWQPQVSGIQLIRLLLKNKP